MGFIQIANVGTPAEIHGIWNRYIDTGELERVGRCTPLDIQVKDNSRFLVRDNQAIALFSGEKFVDCCVGAGAFVYHKTFACGKHTEETAKLWERYYAEGDGFSCDDGQDLSCILVDMSDFIRIPFTFDEAVYHDNSYDLDIVLCGSGYIEIGEINPLASYAGVQYSKEKFLNYKLPELTEEKKKELAVDFENAFEQTLIDMREVDIDYNKIPYCAKKVLELANGVLLDKWDALGLAVKTVAFSSIYPDENSVSAIVKIRRERAAQQNREAMEQQISEGNQQSVQQPQMQLWPKQPLWQRQPKQPKQPKQFFGMPAQNMPAQAVQAQAVPVQNGVQEYVIRSGICNWVKTPYLVQNGQGVLTNSRFLYQKGKMNLALTGIMNKVMGGDKNFEFPLSELVGIEIGQQGIAKTVIFKLNGGITFVCVFQNMQEWLAEFRKLQICAVPDI